MRLFLRVLRHPQQKRTFKVIHQYLSFNLYFFLRWFPFVRFCSQLLLMFLACNLGFDLDLGRFLYEFLAPVSLSVSDLVCWESTVVCGFDDSKLVVVWVIIVLILILNYGSSFVPGALLFGFYFFSLFFFFGVRCIKTISWFKRFIKFNRHLLSDFLLLFHCIFYRLLTIKTFF